MRTHRTNFSFDHSKQFPSHGHLPGAHHPHCPRHENHLIWIGSRPLCLGSTCMYSGMVLGAIGGTFIVIHADFTWMQMALGILLTVVPTAFQPWVQNKSYKIFARTLLGASVGILTLVLVTGYSLPGLFWKWRIGLIITFLVIYRFLFWLRQIKPNDPCVNCPEGVYPVCEWNLSNVCSATNDPKLLAALQYQRDVKPEVIRVGEGDQASELSQREDKPSG